MGEDHTIDQGDRAISLVLGLLYTYKDRMRLDVVVSKYDEVTLVFEEKSYCTIHSDTRRLRL